MPPVPHGPHNVAYLQTKEHKKDIKTDQRGAEKMDRMIDKLVKDLATAASLFFFKFNAHTVGAVKSHFNTSKKTHQHDGKNKPYNDAYFKHGGVKIIIAGRCSRL